MAMRIDLNDGKVIEFVRGDITQETTDAIVNAANAALSVGGGVCGAIHRAAGPEIAAECDAITSERGPLKAGEAVATSAGRLAARNIIHAVGPIWKDGASSEAQDLTSCYREAIRIADDLGLDSVSFPSISTGIYGYPLHLAASVAQSAVREALLAARNVSTVRFVLFDDASLDAYRQAAVS
jgi:O-acetyl-ADP-ribose deacetylase (regulator of RNase III)